MRDNNIDFVGFLETKKECFQESFLKYVHKDFKWHLLPAVGTAGGILVGVHDMKLDILARLNGQFCVSVMIKNCNDNFVWRLIVVYGSPYEEGKIEFIQELENFLGKWDGPTVIGGDFNLVSSSKDKSNGIVNFKWVNMFQNWINSFVLIELRFLPDRIPGPITNISQLWLL